mmetsp:Transcript_10665/g.14610  ORF Transcript_10665/g.14610 Transcript_10665/m.14610 type:complete len:333 (+) Transcript_10665:89-1087(+)
MLLVWGTSDCFKKKKNPSNCWVNEDFVLQDDEVYIFVKPQETAVIDPVKFFELLKRSDVKKPSEKVLNKVRKYFASQALLVTTPQQARDLYFDAADIPDTTTREQLRTHKKLWLDGPLNPSNESRSKLFFAFFEGIPKVLKFPPVQAAKHEAEISKILGDDAVKNSLVAPITEWIIDRTAGQPAQLALLMPIYPCTLEQVPNPIPENYAMKCGMQIEIAIKFMHSKAYAHLDIKPSNIFLDNNGDFFLGDFGAATKFGDPIIESSELYFPSDLPKVASQIADYYLLIATLLEKMNIPFGTDSGYPTTTSISAAVGKLPSPIKEFLLQLLVVK